MNELIRSTAMIALGFSLLVVQATMSTVFHLDPFVPNLVLPLVIFLGVSPDVEIARGAAVAFVLGYLFDLYSGNRMGVATFVMVLTFMTLRGAGFRLFLRGPQFQIPLTFVVGMFAGGAEVTIRAVFEPRPPVLVDATWNRFGDLSASALVTALAAPLLFHAGQRVEALMATNRREDGSAAP